MKTWNELEEKIKAEPEYIITNDILDIINALNTITAEDGDMPFALSMALWEMRPALFNVYYVKAWEMMTTMNVDFPDELLSYNEICEIVEKSAGVCTPEVFEVSDAVRTDAPVGGIAFLASEDVMFSEIDMEELMFDTEDALTSDNDGNNKEYVPKAVVEYSFQDEYRCRQPINGIEIEYLGSSIPKSFVDFCGKSKPWERSTVVVEVIRKESEVM